MLSQASAAVTGSEKERGRRCYSAPSTKRHYRERLLILLSPVTNIIGLSLLFIVLVWQKAHLETLHFS